MNITYDEFMNMQLERLSQCYKNVIKIERLNGINNNQSTQFKLYFERYIEVITMTPNQEPHDTSFRLVNVQR
ncbi:MAG: hypothetical protein WA833_07115 [Nitrosotalea sp.]